MKKKLILLLGLFMVVSGAFAQVYAIQEDKSIKDDNITNDNQKGSLLVWPKIQVQGVNKSDTSRELIDTIIEIANDAPGDAPEANLVCYYTYTYNVAATLPDGTTVYKTSDPVYQYFTMQLEPGAVKYWSVRTGKGSPSTYAPILYRGDDNAGLVGELKCWATEADYNEQVAYNHLYGNATLVYQSKVDVAEYNSWNFQAGLTEKYVRTGKTEVGEPGWLLLNGSEYDSCPDYLVTDYLAQNRAMATGTLSLKSTGTEIALVSCKEDFSQRPKLESTKLVFEIYWQSTGQIFNSIDARDLFDSTTFVQVRLADISRFFTAQYYQGRKARLVLRTDCDTDRTGSCASNDFPIIGTVINFYQKDTKTNVQFVGARNFNMSNKADRSGFIYWPTDEDGWQD